MSPPASLHGADRPETVTINLPDCDNCDTVITIDQDCRMSGGNLQTILFAQLSLNLLFKIRTCHATGESFVLTVQNWTTFFGAVRLTVRQWKCWAIRPLQAVMSLMLLWCDDDTYLLTFASFTCRVSKLNESVSDCSEEENRMYLCKGQSIWLGDSIRVGT